jgi:outer membrane protein assembly factor BamE (lipoprotein component of BamABCDE complex)
MKIFFLNVLVLIQMFAICGCTNNELVYHGYSFNDVNNLEIQLENFKKSTASKQTILETLGSPTFIETNSLQESEFFYVENIFVKKPYIGNKKIETKILKIQFNSNDKMEGFKLYKTNKEDAFDSSIETKVQGNEMKFFEQMKKNLSNADKKIASSEGYDSKTN